MKLRVFPSLLLVVLVLLAGCRAAGPGKPARTVAEFFNKYENRPGFKATDWNAGLATRFILGRLGKLGGDNDITQALSSIRNARVITFSPTTSSARNLVASGLMQEVDGLLANERYSPLATTATDQTAQLRYSVREQGGRVSEFVAVGNVQGAPDTFMLVSVAGNFTRDQVSQLTKILPSVISQ